MSFNDNAQLDPSQVEDQRGRRMGGGGGMIAGGGGITVVILVVALLLGVDPTAILNAVPTDTAPVDSTSQQTIAECKTGADANRREDCRIVGYVDSVQQFWTAELTRRGKQYTLAPTVLFTGATQAGCGTASAEMGPVNCPVDKSCTSTSRSFESCRPVSARRATGSSARPRGASHPRPGHTVRQRSASSGSAPATRPVTTRGARHSARVGQGLRKD